MESENSLPLLLEKLSVAVVLKPSATLQIMETFLQTVLNQRSIEKSDSKFGSMSLVCEPTNRVDVCSYTMEKRNTSEPFIPGETWPTLYHVVISYDDEVESEVKNSMSNILTMNNLKKFSDDHGKNSMMHIVVNKGGENLLQYIKNALSKHSWTGSVYIETDFRPYALSGSATPCKVKFPSILKGVMCANLFETVLRDNVRGVMEMVISNPNHSALHVHRFRWLLLIFHTCLECHFAADIHCRHVIISVDLLHKAFDLIDDLFSQDLATAVAPRTIDYTGSSAGLCPSSFSHLIEYIIDCVYSTAAHTDAEKGTARAIYRRVFASGFQDCSTSYHIRDSVVVPQLFGEGDSSAAFLKRVSQSLFSEVGPIDWIGRSMPEENSLQRSYFRLALQRYQSNESLSSPRMNAGIAMEGSLCLLRSTFSKLLALLPSKIKTESREIIQQMTGHVRLVGGSHPHRPPRTPPQASARRQGNRLLARYQSREFDPLWAFVLSECFEFNKLVESLREQLQNFSEASDDLLLYRLQKCCTSRDNFMLWLDSLRRGLVPSSWLCGSCEPLPTLEDWVAMLHDRRKILADWLLSGQPGPLKLSLLRSPSSLLHALKEKFSMNLDGAVDQVHCKVTLVDRAALSPESISSLKDPNLNFGCNVLVEDCYLHNATFRFGEVDDEENNSGGLEILPAFSTSTFGQVCGS